MNLADFHFLRPLWLLSLIPYGISIFFLLRSTLSHNVWSAVCDAELLPYLLREKASKQSHGQLVTGALAALLTIVALAGPTWQRLPSPVFRNASAVVIVLDLSPSMNAEDVKPSRLIRARYKIADILKQRKDGQSALIVYAGDAHTVTPLTDDIDTIDNQLSALTTDIMPSGGSDTLSALQKAVELFKQAGLQNGDIILITSGVDQSQVYVSDMAKNYHLSILGVGTADGAPIALPEGGFLKDERGAIVMPKLNASELAGLAQAGGGIYQTITADDSDVQALLAQVDSRLNNAMQENKSNSTVDQWDDKGAWLLLAVLPLAALSFRKGILCLAVLLLLPLPKNSYALEWQDLWLNNSQKAWKAVEQYKAQQYGQSAQTLESRIKSGKANSDDYYNQGNALAQTGKLSEAIQAYEQALQRNPHNDDAKANKELVEKELKKQQQEQKNQQQQQNDKQENSKDEPQNLQDGQEKSANDSEAEQKPQQSQEKNADDLKNQPQQDAKVEKAQEQQVKQAEQQAKEEKKPVEAKPIDEVQQANEQWLKRIPDDPAGLLRRKFKRQYELREQE